MSSTGRMVAGAVRRWFQDYIDSRENTCEHQDSDITLGLARRLRGEDDGGGEEGSHNGRRESQHGCEQSSCRTLNESERSSSNYQSDTLDRGYDVITKHHPPGDIITKHPHPGDIITKHSHPGDVVTKHSSSRRTSVTSVNINSLSSTRINMTSSSTQINVLGMPPDYYSASSSNNVPSPMLIAGSTAERVCCCERCSPQCDSAYVQLLQPVLTGGGMLSLPMYDEVLIRDEKKRHKRSASFGSVLQRSSIVQTKDDASRRLRIGSSSSSVIGSSPSLETDAKSAVGRTRYSCQDQRIALSLKDTLSFPDFPISTTTSSSAASTATIFSNLPPSICISRDGEEGFVASQRVLAAHNRVLLSRHVIFGTSSVPPNRTICHIDS